MFEECSFLVHLKDVHLLFSALTDRNPCLSNPCDVNADCTRLSLSNGNFTCICRPEYTGDGFSCSGMLINAYN